MEDDSEAIRRLRETIKERLTPSQMMTYDSLVEDFTSHRIGTSEMTTSLLRLFKNDKYLHQRFTEVANDLEEEQEDENGEAQDDDEVTDVEETIRDPTKIGDENAKEDPPVHGEAKIEEDGVEIRVKEDDMSETDMLIGYVKRAMELAEKAMKGEIKMEDLGVEFYGCVQQLHRGDSLVKRLSQNYEKALPDILQRMKQKLNELEVTRQRDSAAKGRRNSDDVSYRHGDKKRGSERED